MRAKIRPKNLQKILRLSSNLVGWSLNIPGNKTRHVIVPQVYMECITEPEIFPRLPCIVWVIIVEPFYMERHRSRFLFITLVIKNSLNEILHVIATCCISRHAQWWVIIENLKILHMYTIVLMCNKFARTYSDPIKDTTRKGPFHLVCNRVGRCSCFTKTYDPIGNTVKPDVDFLCLSSHFWIESMAASRTLSCISIKSVMYVEFEDDTIGNKWGVKNPLIQIKFIRE